jgi:mRNA interferase MazF
MVSPEWGDVWWVEAPEEKPRPYLVLTRNAAIPVLVRVLVAPVTTNVRRIPTELPLGDLEGLPFPSVASMDNVTTMRKSYMVRRAGAIAPSRRRELCAALAAAIDC